MTFTRKLLALAAASALSFCFMACDDDSSDNGGNGGNGGGSETKTCTAADNKCQGSILMTCGDDGKMKVEDCSVKSMACDQTKLACVSTGGGNETKTECTVDVCADETHINYCNNGKWEGTKDCNLESKTCKKGKCFDELNYCEAEGVTRCALGDNTRYQICDGATNLFKEETIACPDGATCRMGACSKPVVYDAETTIGKKCSCTGNDCTFTISGAELNDALLVKELVKVAVGTDIPDGDLIVAPNYFSKSIKGCEDLIAPEGMAVGCLTGDENSKIKGTPAFIDYLKAVKKKMLEEFKLEEINGIQVEPLIDRVLGIIEAGIPFTAPNGYCILADIDIKLNVDEDAKLVIPDTFEIPAAIKLLLGTIELKIGKLVDMSKVKKLVEKINTPGHDHVKAKQAICPDGSQKLWYDVNSDSEYGSANVGFDLCLKACQTDNDCRKDEGYKCIVLPYGTAENIEKKDQTAKVCFDPANITYFEGLTKEFQSIGKDASK